MPSIYSAGSASVQIVPDFRNAQKRIGEWFANQRDVKVGIKPEVDNVALAAARAEAGRDTTAKIHFKVEKKELARNFVEAIDFLTGYSAVQGALRKLFDVKPILITSLVGAGTAVASALSQTIGAVALAPAALSALVAPIGAAIVGFQGIGDAFKNIGSAGDPKKLAAALKDLAPAAREAVTGIHSLAGAWKDLRLDVQQHLFEGIGDSIKQLGKDGIPVLRQGLVGLADGLNGMFKGVIGQLDNPATLGDIGTVFTNLKPVIEGLGKAIAPFLNAIIQLAAAGSGFLVPLVDGLAKAAQKFDAFITKVRGNGQLDAFIQNSIDAFKSLFSIIGNLGSALGGIFQAALPAGKVLLGVLDQLTQGLAMFIHSDVGQTSLTTFFDQIASAATELVQPLLDLGEAMIVGVLPAMSGFVDALAPVVGGVMQSFAGLLETLAPLLYPTLAQAIAVAASALTPLVNVFSAIVQTVLPPLIKLIEALAPKFTELAETVGAGVVKAVKSLAPLIPPLAKAFLAVVDALLPLIPVGLNLANAVIPPLVVVMKALAAALQFIAPILPQVVAGFVLFKTIGFISAMMAALSASLEAMAYRMAALAEKAPIAGAAMKGLSGALVSTGIAAEGAAGFLSAGLAIALGVLTALFIGGTIAAQKHSEAIQRDTDELIGWYRAVASGGDGATQAMDKIIKKQQELTDARTEANRLQDEFDKKYGGDKGRAAGQTTALGEAADKAKDKVKDLKKEFDDAWAALTPLEKAEFKVAEAIAQHGQNSQETKEAVANYNLVQQQSEFAAYQVAQATQTEIDKLKAKQEAQEAAANADIAYQRSQLNFADTLQHYNEVMASGTATAEDRTRAELDMKQAILDQVSAARQKAEADNANLDTAGKQRAADAAALQALKEMADQTTGPFHDAIMGQIADLQAAMDQTNYTRGAVEEMGRAVIDVPDSKSVVIDAPTDDQKKRLQDLGYTVINIPGSKNVLVTADATQADAELRAFVSKQWSLRITAHVNVSPGDIQNAKANIEHLGGAIGGIVHAFAKGGFQQMKGGIAQIVAPNTWRVIGDRVKDDEAYIPINSDARSQQILDITASRMGYELVPMAMGGVLPPGLADVLAQTNRASSLSVADASLRKRAVIAAGGAATVAGFVNNGTVLTTDLPALARKSRIGTQRALTAAGF